MQFLTKEALQKLSVTPKMERVDIPEWDGFIYVREMRSVDRDQFEGLTFDVSVDGKVIRHMDNYRAKFVIFTACDESGQLVFTLDDIGWLGEKQASAVDRLFQAARKLNGMTVEEAEKNLGAATGEGSSSS